MVDTVVARGCVWLCVAVCGCVQLLVVVGGVRFFECHCCPVFIITSLTLVCVCVCVCVCVLY